MKRFLTLLSFVTLFAGLLPGQLASAYTGTYTGVNNSNDYFFSTIQNTGGVLTEKTTAASSSSSNDVTLYRSSGSELLLGYSNPFDGLSAQVYNSASGGSYSVKYWNGSSWASLVSTSSASISNSTDGTFQVEWTRPSNWTTSNILMNMDEDGVANQYSSSYFFVKLSVDSSYSSDPTFTQFGVINYNLKVNVEDQFGNTPSSYSSSYSFSSSADATVYVSKNAGNGLEYYGFYTPLAEATYSYTATVTGFVQESSSTTLGKYQKTLTLNLDYAHKIYAEDSSNGNNVTISSAYAGTSNTTCTISSGVAYCPVPTSQDGGTATLSASGYNTTSVSIPNRTSDTDAQQTTYVSMTSSSTSSTDPDLTVDDLYFDGTALLADIGNEGNEDVSSSDTVYVYVYIDGDRDYSGTIGYNYFDSGENNSFAFLDGEFNDGQSYDVEVCIDAQNDVSESDENDNCRDETITMNGNSSNNADLDVTDIYLDSSDDLNFTVTNNGTDDVDNGTNVTIKIYVDGDVQYTKTVSQSSSSTNFLDESEEDTYNAGSILDDEGSSYDVEVCVDTGNDVDEDSESNNCMSVNEDTIDTQNTNSSCGDFTDLDNEWSEEYVCDLYDRDIVNGRTDTRFYPDSSTTRAEFLKMVLLDAELDPYSVSSEHFNDVSSGSWYYSYVTYAAAMGYVDGYSDGSFKPNQAITRAEALVILMRVADQNDYSFNESDIDFWDVDVDDWYAYAVVTADQDNIVDGYSNGSFGPYNSITRGEAAKILDLAYSEYFN